MLTAAALLAVSAAGCGKKEEEKDLLETVTEKGVITIAMEGTWSPWTYHNEKDELVGFDVEIGQYIADFLGVNKYSDEKNQRLCAFFRTVVRNYGNECNEGACVFPPDRTGAGYHGTDEEQRKQTARRFSRTDRQGCRADERRNREDHLVGQ